VLGPGPANAVREYEDVYEYDDEHPMIRDRPPQSENWSMTADPLALAMPCSVRNSSRMSDCLRLATEADLSLLVALMSEFYAESNYPLEVERAAGALRRLVAEPALGRIWMVGAADAQAVGYIAVCYGFSLEYYGRDAFVDDFFIRPAFRGRGLGGRALTQVIELCRAAGVLALHLEAGRDNTPAQVLYRRRGFRDNDRQLLSLRLAEE